MITFQIEHRDELVIVRLDGPLTARTAPVVRGVLLKGLAECPTALIVDVGRVDVDSDLPLTVFRAAQRQAAQWPGIPVLLCRPGPALADRLANRAMARHLAVHASLEDAIAALKRPMRAQPAVRADLPATAHAGRQARELVVEACRGWGLDHLVDDAEVITSELASNAVRHARPLLQLVVATRGDYLHIAVRDGSESAPRVAVVSGGAPADGRGPGHGLRLIDALATAWGSLPTADGKVVWATLRARPI
jgi:anti-anti-sigma regulatory factor/anti-sigma regulatory factor (Ser/Thr protein kinase)